MNLKSSITLWIKKLQLIPLKSVVEMFFIKKKLLGKFFVSLKLSELRPVDKIRNEIAIFVLAILIISFNLKVNGIIGRKKRRKKVNS